MVPQLVLKKRAKSVRLKSGTEKDTVKDVKRELKKDHTKPKKRPVLPEAMYPFRTITHPTADIQHPAILLHTSQGKRYIFGKVPEGLQRCLNEQKLRVSKLYGIFLTGKLNWESIGGLPGLILTVSDQGKKDLNLFHGSNILEYVVSTWRYYVFRFGMALNPRVIAPHHPHRDEIMDVQAFVINSSKSDNNEPLSDEVSEKLRAIVQRMFPLDVNNNTPVEMESDGVSQKSDPTLSDPYIHVKLPDIEAKEASTCYAIDLHPVRGKFNPKKAIELGIPKGPLFAKLANGSEITLDDGTVIKPDQVVSEQRIFKRILILDVPSIDYTESLLSTQWGENVGIVYHFLGKDIDPFDGEYMKFIREFGPACTHYISHPLYSPNSLTFNGSSKVILKLKTLQLDKYNLPESSGALVQLPHEIPANIKILVQGQVVNIEAAAADSDNKYTFDDSAVSLKTEKDWSNTYDTEVTPLDLKTNNTKEQVLDLKNVSSNSIDPDQPLKGQVETITFGTGSALPSKYRNVISNLVRVPYKKGEITQFRSILLDAGENTLGSMKRTLRQENLESYMRELQLVYLSHLHADHHLGIISILKEWLKFNTSDDDKLYLVTPWQYSHFVYEWLKMETDISGIERIVHISCEDFLVGKTRPQIAQIPFESFMTDRNENKKEDVKFKRDSQSVNQFFQDVGIEKFETCRAYHCDWAYCCSISLKLDSDSMNVDNDNSNTFKVSYSGDTRPNTYMFAEVIGQNSDLLIHEATLENDLLEEAKKKRHCTINEAIEVSNVMKSRKLILTHFSQRYPQLPQISNNTVVEADYCFAFDSMIVKFSDIGDQTEVFDQLDIAFASEKNEKDEDS